MKLIREVDDFDWIREIPLNPWLIGDGIYFDIKPKADDIRSYIQMALDTRKVDNSRHWHAPYNSDVDTILFYFERNGSAVLGIDKDEFNSLTLGNNTFDYADDIKWIKYSDLVRGRLNESQDDGLDWIRDIPGEYIPYGDIKEGNNYAVRLNPLLFEALQACGNNLEKFKHADRVYVNSESTNEYNNIFCGHPRKDVVRTLLLLFSHGDVYINHFWVVEGMVDFLPMDIYINESEDGDLDWIRNIEPEIMLKPYTVYYFEPPLEENEMYGFVNRIGNAEAIKDFLLNNFDVRIKYFVTDKYNQLAGWCDEMDVEDARDMYRNYDFVDTRREFFI